MAAGLRVAFRHTRGRLWHERSASGHLRCVARMVSPALSGDAAGIFPARQPRRTDLLCRRRTMEPGADALLAPLASCDGCRGPAGTCDQSTHERSRFFPPYLLQPDRSRVRAPHTDDYQVKRRWWLGRDRGTILVPP